MSDELIIRSTLRVGDLGRITTLHGETYEPLGGYGLRFEAYVELSGNLLGWNFQWPDFKPAS